MAERPRSALDVGMGRLAEGDRSVIRAVFAELWPVVQAFCARSLGAGADADDAAQAAMEKVFAEASRYDASRSALAWALAVAAWECRTLRRRAQRRREDGADAIDALVARGRSPEEEVELKALGEAARAVLEHLSERDRETLLASFFEEARDRLEVGGATLRKRRERALDRFRQTWRRMYGG